VSFWNTTFVNGTWLGGSDVHGDILANRLITFEIDQNADLAAVDVAAQTVLGHKALEATDGHVFTNLADQCSTGRLDSSFSHRQRAKGLDVSGILCSDEICNVLHELDEVFVFGNEVCLAV